MDLTIHFNGQSTLGTKELHKIVQLQKRFYLKKHIRE